MNSLSFNFLILSHCFAKELLEFENHMAFIDLESHSQMKDGSQEILSIFNDRDRQSAPVEVN